jgi:hypothetical protein
MLMPYRPHDPPVPMMFGYDPVRDLAQEHVARLIERLVEGEIRPPAKRSRKGQPQFDPRLCLKVLLLGYVMGVRSSRQMERLCRENLAFLFLTRGDTPSYRTLCSVRKQCEEDVERLWIALFAIADELGMGRLGRVVLDSTKILANASDESVVKADEYANVREALARIIADAEKVDAREEVEGFSGDTLLSEEVSTDQMRDILRRVRKHEALLKKREAIDESQDSGPSEGGDKETAVVFEPVVCVSKEPGAGTQDTGSSTKRMSDRMYGRVQEAIDAIDAAQNLGLGHVSLTDPDARMMKEGRKKRVRQCFSYEVALDNGLLVASGVTQSNTDNSRLIALIEAAKKNEPNGITSVDADCGYYSGDGILALVESGIDTCIPDIKTAHALHNGGPLTSDRPFIYEADHDRYACSEGNTLTFQQQRHEGGHEYRTYRATRSCKGCPLAKACLKRPDAERRTLKVAVAEQVLRPLLQRFKEPEHRRRYGQRYIVETVFGYLRSVLGYNRWLLRGTTGTNCEGALFTAAYQIRKVHAAAAA